MNISLSPEMERALRERADRLKVSVEEVVSTALSWYMQIEPELLEEMADWEAAGAEALRLVEDSLE
jgi:hypothetical protein